MSSSYDRDVWFCEICNREVSVVGAGQHQHNPTPAPPAPPAPMPGTVEVTRFSLLEIDDSPEDPPIDWRRKATPSAPAPSYETPPAVDARSVVDGPQMGDDVVRIGMAILSLVEGERWDRAIAALCNVVEVLGQQDAGRRYAVARQMRRSADRVARQFKKEVGNG